MKIHLPSVTIHLFLSCLLLICLPIQADTRDISIQPAKLFTQQQKVHIAVGISNYNTKNTGFGRLKYAAKDANLLANTFRSKGYQPITILNHNANKQTILNKIKRAGKLFPKGEGTLIFSFSGHGYKQGGRSYLATYDAYASNLRGTGLTVQEVVHAIRKTGVRRAMLLLDACRNNPIPGRKSVATTKALGGINPGRGIQILYSTNQGSVSWEHQSIQQGVFSYFVNRAIHGGVAGRGGTVTFNDLAQYVMREVPVWTNNRLSETQKPYRGMAGEIYGDFIMVSKKINTARVTPRSRPAVVNQQNKQSRPQVINHYHGQKNHAHVLPNNSMQHRHGQGMQGSRLAIKTEKIQPQNSNSIIVTQPPVNRPSPANYTSLHAAYKRKDYNNAFRIATQLAQKGDSEGEYYLSKMYGTGQGVKKNYNKAFEWASKSAAQGNSGGQRNVGFMYSKGYSVRQNDKQAVEWYRKAALQGHRGAQNNLGVAYERGSGGLKADHKKAIEWYRKAAAQGHGLAARNIGWAYAVGRSVTRDSTQAKIWFKKAIKLGYTKAKKDLVNLETSSYFF